MIFRRLVSSRQAVSVSRHHCVLLFALLLAPLGQTLRAEDPDLPVRIWMRPPTPPSVPEQEVDETLDKGVKYLIDTQRKDGAWGGPQWRGGVDSDPVPGSFRSFDIAIAAMALEALLDSKPSASVTEEELETSRQKALDYLFRKTKGIRRAGPGDLPHIWAHGYSLQTFAKIHSRTDDAELREKLESSMRIHADRLKRWESINGGWFYYGSGMAKPINPSCSFVNSAILVSLARAREVGIDADSKMLDRAIRATQRMRKPDGSFLYTARIASDMAGAAREINRPAGSLGRSQAGNIALRLWGDEKITNDVIHDWLTRLVVRHGWLDMGRKRQIPHESHAAVAGYFYYFGVYYGCLCLDVLSPGEREVYQHHLARILIDRQEPDGSWFDYPLYNYGKPYGTAFALLSLQRCRVTQE
ncbi:MAG: prenyltransferase/squalene oxidase repeat-containing protein [Planctomycetota bacterium]